MSDVPAKLQRFVTPDVVGDVRHLCRVAPHLNDNGRRDEGWSCRLQAFLTALALAADRIPCVVAFGRAGFVVGPSGSRAPSGIDVDPHAWVMIDGNGIFDVSPTFEKTDLETMREWGQAVIVRNTCVPGDRFVAVRSEDEYHREIAIASHAAMCRTAVYLALRYDFVDCAACDRADLIASSPLTERIVSLHSTRVLFSAARHIYELSYGRAKTLASKSQERAWEILSRSTRDDGAWFRKRLPTAVATS